MRVFLRRSPGLVVGWRGDKAGWVRNGDHGMPSGGRGLGTRQLLVGRGVWNGAISVRMCSCKNSDAYLVCVLSSVISASRTTGADGGSFNATPTRSNRLVPLGTSRLSNTSFLVVDSLSSASRLTVCNCCRVWYEKVGWMYVRVRRSYS